MPAVEQFSRLRASGFGGATWEGQGPKGRSRSVWLSIDGERQLWAGDDKECWRVGLRAASPEEAKRLINEGKAAPLRSAWILETKGENK